jgi:hypothetical protein
MTACCQERLIEGEVMITCCQGEINRGRCNNGLIWGVKCFSNLISRGDVHQWRDINE